MHQVRCASLLICIAMVLGFAACGTSSSSNNNNGGGSNAPTLQFSVTPPVAAPGQTVNFAWTSTNATSFSVMPSILGEDQTLPTSSAKWPSVAPATTTTYVGTATGTVNPPATANAALTIVPVTLTAATTTIPSGGTVTFTYSGPNNGSSFSIAALPANTTAPLTGANCTQNTCTGTYTTGPLGANTSFQVTATGPVGGTSTSQPVAITVVGAVTVILTATPPTVNPNGAVTLAWQTTNAVSLSIDNGVGPVTPVTMGSVVVHPAATTTYTATATDVLGATQTATATVTVSTNGISNLNHIIFMLQENRTFDNYFGKLGTYRAGRIVGAKPSDVDDLDSPTAKYLIQNPAGQKFGPYHQRTECIENLSPSWDESHTDMDIVGDYLHVTPSTTYKMDKFLFTTLSGGTHDQYDPTHTRPLGYYDQTDLPFYYEVATQFATSDRFFSPVPANTVLNRMYLFAGTSYGTAYPPPSTDPAWQQPTIFRALTKAGITWRYYYLDNSVFLFNWADWNDPVIQGNVRSIQEYYNILSSPNADQQLPQVVFIERASVTGGDEHPSNNIQTGAAIVQQIMNALFTSKAWPDSAFILTYDEGGGLFDHVGPVLVTPPDNQTPNDIQGHIQGLFNITGFRLPLMVVSPWVKPHYVSHLPMDYTAILKLIETRYGVPPLTQRDAMPSADMTDFFDFSTPHLLTVPPLPTQPTNGVCDYTLESSPNAPQ